LADGCVCGVKVLPGDAGQEGEHPIADTTQPIGHDLAADRELGAHGLGLALHFLVPVDAAARPID